MKIRREEKEREKKKGKAIYPNLKNYEVDRKTKRQ